MITIERNILILFKMDKDDSFTPCLFISNLCI